VVNFEPANKILKARITVMVPPPSRPNNNKILAAIYEAEGAIGYVYFPETAVFSMLSTMEDGRTVEVGPVGNEGLVGLRVFLGAEKSLDQVIVHIAGDAKRMRVSHFKRTGAIEGSSMADKLLRYTQMLLAMTAQSGACNKLHTTEQQLARWLLMMRDYVGDELALTHDLIALTLGVRRAGVSEAANGFRNAGVIDYRRGHMQIIDQRGLEAIACECYAAVKKEYDALYEYLSQPSEGSEFGA
jgi:CRP-like cAMP-binding protein